MSLLSTDSPQTTARLAGALWLIVIAVSIASLFTAPSVSTGGSPAQTAASILAAETPYRLAFALLFVGSLCYLGVTALLYELLRPVNGSIALFGAFALCAVIAYVLEGYYDLGLSWFRVAVVMGCLLGALEAAGRLMPAMVPAAPRSVTRWRPPSPPR